MKHKGSELDLAVRRTWRRAKLKMEPKIRAAVAAQPLMDSDMAVALVVSENVLRDCTVSVLQDALPQGRDFFVELATRLAANVLTALHPDDQEVAALRVQRGLMSKLADKQAAGHGLRSEWE